MAIFHFTLDQSLKIAEHYRYLVGRQAYINPENDERDCVITAIEPVAIQGTELWNVRLFAECTGHKDAILIIPYLKDFGIDFEAEKFDFSL
jgi:hypothetical protein